MLAIIAVITLMGLGLIRFLINYAEAKACEDACKNSSNPRAVDMYDGSYFCGLR